MHDCLIVGGGVIGLSLAYELARSQLSVRVIDRGEPGREASWAGAGILPPANPSTANHPLEKLRGLSHQLHRRWSTELRAETGIDNGYRRCGALYLARSGGEAAALHAFAAECEEVAIEAQRLSLDELLNVEPALRESILAGHVRAAYRLPDESQIRNPHHLQALASACRRLGVHIDAHVEALDFVVHGERMLGIETNRGRQIAERYCITSGAWTYPLLRKLNIENGILPVRGQMILFRCLERPFSHILNEGSRYLVPRDDGRVLAGSTEEEARFDKRTTRAALDELAEFARGIAAPLRNTPIETSWAGLRPGTFDGFPYLGRVPALTNVFVSAGHFRSGLHLSTGSAVVMAQLIRGAPTEVDLSPFRVGRG